MTVQGCSDVTTSNVMVVSRTGRQAHQLTRHTEQHDDTVWHYASMMLSSKRVMFERLYGSVHQSLPTARSPNSFIVPALAQKQLPHKAVVALAHQKQWCHLCCSRSGKLEYQSRVSALTLGFGTHTLVCEHG